MSRIGLGVVVGGWCAVVVAASKNWHEKQQRIRLKMKETHVEEEIEEAGGRWEGGASKCEESAGFGGEDGGLDHDDSE